MDKKETGELLDFILMSIGLIEKRFESIEAPSEFLADEKGLEKLDSISMRLQSIGEAIKSLMKRDIDTLLVSASREYWSQIVRTRDIISHHYIDLDAEIVYEICDEELEELKQKVERARENLDR